MPKVDPEVLEKAAKKKEEEAKSVPTKLIGGRTYFRGAGDEWYDNHGEALESLQTEKQQSEFKKLGLDQYGRTKEDVERAEKVKVLVDKRNKLIDEIRVIDIEIAHARTGAMPLDEKETKKKKK